MSYPASRCALSEGGRRVEVCSCAVLLTFRCCRWRADQVFSIILLHDWFNWISALSPALSIHASQWLVRRKQNKHSLVPVFSSALSLTRPRNLFVLPLAYNNHRQSHSHANQTTHSGLLQRSTLFTSFLPCVWLALCVHLVPSLRPSLTDPHTILLPLYVDLPIF